MNIINDICACNVMLPTSSVRSRYSAIAKLNARGRKPIVLISNVCLPCCTLVRVKRPSGPVIDDRTNMRASLVHDALYQLMRNNHLNLGTDRQKADKLFEKMCIQDGVPKGIARAFYFGLRAGGKPAASPRNKKKVRRAP